MELAIDPVHEIPENGIIKKAINEPKEHAVIDRPHFKGMIAHGNIFGK